MQPDDDGLVLALTNDHGVAPELAAAIAERFDRRHVHADGEYVLRAGERHAALYFIERGVWRASYPTADGRQYNKAFVTGGMFFCALTSLLTDAPSCFDVQVLCESRARSMPFAQFAAWGEREPDVARLWLRYMQRHFVRHEAREAALQQLDAEGRYRWFLSHHPGLVDRVPLYHVASYLGMTDVTLSRVRRLVARTPSRGS